MDIEDQKTVLRQIYAELNITQKEYTFKQILSIIHNYKSGFGYIEYILNGKKGDANNTVDLILNKYLFKQQKNYALDFDDLINFTLYIFKNNKNTLSKWQKRIHYIQVDETQDSNRRQFELVNILSEYHKNLFVVGDPDQTIYEWRGAIPEILVDFDKQFPDCKTIMMNQNYRSTPNILDIGNHIIKNNKIRVDKDMFTKKQKGFDVIHFHAKNDFEESLWVINEIKEIRKQKETKLSDITILYRAHFISRSFEQALIKENIPYTVFGGIRFFERKEIKDVLAYLRLIAIGDDISFLRVINTPRRGLGKKFVENLSKIAEDTKVSLFDALSNNLETPTINKKGAKDFFELINTFKEKQTTLCVSDLVKFVLDKTGLTKLLREDGDTDRNDNVKELVSSIILLEKDSEDELKLIEYLQEIALYTNKDVKEEEDGRVNLMTIHTSKGLEYPYVFLCGFSDGILPSAIAIKERRKRAIEEERRLTYVAITRAEKRFYMTEAEGFNFSTGEQKYPSRFLFEINEKFYVQKGEINKSYFQEAKNYMAFENALINGETQFKKGDLVNHPVWSLGKIISVNFDKGEYEIDFFEKQIVKPILFEYKYFQIENEKSLEEDTLGKVELKSKQETENFADILEDFKIKQEVKSLEKEQEKLKIKEAGEIVLKEQVKLKQEVENIEKEQLELKAKKDTEIVRKEQEKNIWVKLKKKIFR